MPYIEGVYVSPDRFEEARDELLELRKARGSWVRVTLPGRPRLLFCGACNLSDAVDTDDAVSVSVTCGTLCDGCGERAP